MGCVTENWFIRVRGLSRFSPKMTLNGRIYHYIGSLVPPVLATSFIYFYIHDTYYDLQVLVTQQAVPDLNPIILHYLISILHEVNP